MISQIYGEENKIKNKTKLKLTFRQCKQNINKDIGYQKGKGRKVFQSGEGMNSMLKMETRFT